MKTFGLIGKDIAYSLSPIIQNEIAKAIDQHIDYHLIDIDKDALKSQITALKQETFQGFNVTKPYKSSIMQYVDDYSSVALRIGAINTIMLKDGLVYGDNTDYEGFKQLILTNKIEVKDKKVVLLGNGGAARACYLVLKDLGAEVLVASRAPLNHHALFKKMVHYEALTSDCDLYVNTVSVGIDVFNLYAFPYNDQALMIDINYQKDVTQPMSYFKSSINGLDMLIHQAICSQALWLNQNIKLTPAQIKKIKAVITHE